MLVVCVGMQKSGSALFYRMINELIFLSGGSDAFKVKEEYGLEGILIANNNFGKVRSTSFFRLVWLAKKHNLFFAVKTHKGPTWLMRVFLRLGWIKIFYQYRDPRDVLLSAMDHGQRIRERGERTTFGKLDTTEKAIFTVRSYFKRARKYKSMHGIQLITYEGLIENGVFTMGIAMDYLEAKIPKEEIANICAKYVHRKAGVGNQLHFNKGIIGRFKVELSIDDQLYLGHSFRKEISDFGYGSSED